MSATQAFTVTVIQPVQPTLKGPLIAIGQFGFWITGDAGPDYTILASTNLNSWNLLFTANSPILPFFWADTNSLVFSRRFYRVRLGP